MTEPPGWRRAQQLTGITIALFVIGAVLQVIASAVNLLYPETFTAPGADPALVPMYVAISLLVAFAIAFGIIAWTRVIRRWWTTYDRRGYRHTRILSIVLIVIGAVGTLSSIPLFAELAFTSTPETILSIVSLVSIDVSVATLLVGILLLRTSGSSDVRARFAAPTT